MVKKDANEEGMPRDATGKIECGKKEHHRTSARARAKGRDGRKMIRDEADEKLREGELARKDRAEIIDKYIEVHRVGVARTRTIHRDRARSSR